MSYQFRTQLRGQSLWTSAASYQGLQDPIIFGQTVPDPSFTFIGQSGQNWQHVLIPLAVVSGTPQVFDLKNASNSLLDNVNRPVQISKLYFAMLQLTAPGSGISLQWGPNGVSNAAQLWFGGVGSGSLEVVDYEVIRPSFNGWSLTAGTASKIQISNPGTGTVNGFALFAGTM